jgi:hypothetical protein
MSVFGILQEERDVFAILQEERDAWNLHDNVAWVGNTLLCAAKVDPSMIYNEELPQGIRLSASSNPSISRDSTEK